MTVKEGKKVSTFKECIITGYRHHKEGFIVFLTVNIIILCVVAVFPFYCKYMWEGAGKDSSTCRMIEYLHLYCPVCGGTRAVWYLLHLDIVKAFIYSPVVVVCAAVFAYCDVRALIALLKDQRRIMYLNSAMVCLIIGTLIGVWIIRNILLITVGYDPLGDIGDFWKVIIDLKFS